MNKLLFIPIVLVIFAVIQLVFVDEKPLNQPIALENTAVEIVAKQSKENDSQAAVQVKPNNLVVDKPTIILPEGAKIVQDPMADFVSELGYQSSAIEKFTQFTGKDVILLEELPAEEKRSVKQDIEEIALNGFANVSSRSAELFYDAESYIATDEVPAERLSFQYVDVSNEIEALGYDYIGVISPHEDVYTQAAWNSLIQVYKKADHLISVDQGNLGQGGTAFITEGYDNVYLNKEYPASYLKNQSEDGLAYYSLYFSSGKSVYELKSSTANKEELVALAEEILRKDTDKKE
ncbi:hypothetical protein H0A36_14530 [Endozoicomonas sp. SM1973]|uniref:Uncharacterized protein n=2 Tax=Spartinivicinus marinus TaxID=2994442 RepID=A0A853IBJ6_9GAMM|nr:hypothetical protein [Spartinivicinus marinus]MCX4028564.1 hypothetical protein [Spartinivicinus marinus]NYZ67231.1 hypothetical protein [Spartinivicinus marinus]